MSALTSFRNGRGIRKVSHTPAFILSIMGRCHASNDLEIAEAYVDKLRAKCITLENREVMKAEKLLFEFRREADGLLANIRAHAKVISGIPAPVAGNQPDVIRANAQNKGNRLNYTSAINTAYNRLIQINEMIVDVDTCLEQRILKTRNLCTEKISAYVMGVRYIDNDFSFDKSFDNIALDLYRKQHSVTDTAVANAVGEIYSTYKGGSGNESL